jgi:SAM-dependent methyltransferase
MALSWKQAQEREVEFWKAIYVDKQEDIESYRPITDDKALEFCLKTLARFDLTPANLQNRTMADVGCGPYGLIRGLSVDSKKHNLGPKCMIGIDPLMDTYREFNTLPLGESIKLITSRGEAIPVGNEVCDFVFSVNVVDHVESPQQLLKECRRIMKRNGKTLLAVHVVRPPFTFFRHALYLIDKNHPHHFSETGFLRMTSQVFPKLLLTRRVSMIEDQPDFTFGAIFRNPGKVRGVKRWLSNFLLRSIYIECKNE